MSLSADTTRAPEAGFSVSCDIEFLSHPRENTATQETQREKCRGGGKVMVLEELCEIAFSAYSSRGFEARPYRFHFQFPKPATTPSADLHRIKVEVTPTGSRNVADATTNFSQKFRNWATFRSSAKTCDFRGHEPSRLFTTDNTEDTDGSPNSRTIDNLGDGLIFASFRTMRHRSTKKTSCVPLSCSGSQKSAEAATAR